jgi:hypoxanthine-DNA glycosylase
MNRIFSFPPISSPAARVLVLGSMPGKRSLEMQQYYAHPQNAFWRIMGELFGFDPGLPYPGRVECLQKAGIALWDVMAACERPSSLDSDIVESSIVANDFPGFFMQHPQIRGIYCNGAKSWQSYRRHVLGALSPEQSAIPFTRLPSTSPAHATMNFQAKITAWNAITDSLDKRPST